MNEVTPVEMKAELDSGTNLMLVDVREDDELAISVLPGVLHIPLGQLTTRFSEIPKESNVIMICRSGGRSGKATDFLISEGYESVRNMIGGMKGYAAAIDPSMPVA